MHGAESASLCDINHHCTHVIELLLAGPLAGVLDEDARAGAVQELLGEFGGRNHIAHAVGAKNGEIAIRDVRLETVRLDLRAEADGAAKNVALIGVHMVVRELFELSAARKIHARVADVQPVKTVAFEHGDAERGDEFGAVETRDRFAVERLVDRPRKFTQRALRRPRARACGVVHDQALDDPVRSLGTCARSAHAVGERGDHRLAVHAPQARIAALPAAAREVVAGDVHFHCGHGFKIRCGPVRARPKSCASGFSRA